MIQAYKTIIRHGTFETNSSSAHTFILASDFIKDFNEERLACESIYKDGCISVWTGEYGWDFDILDTPSNKLDYIFTYKINYESTESAINFLKELYPEASHIRFQGETISIDDFSSYIEDIKENSEVWSYPFGYIDHESTHILSDLSHSDLKGLIFSEKSLILTGNDNDSDRIPFPSSILETTEATVIKKFNEFQNNPDNKGYGYGDRNKNYSTADNDVKVEFILNETKSSNKYYGYGYSKCSLEEFRQKAEQQLKKANKNTLK